MKPNEIVTSPSRRQPPSAASGDEPQASVQKHRSQSRAVEGLQAAAAQPLAPARQGCLPTLFAPRAPRPLPPSAKRPFIAVSPTLVRGRRPYVHELDRLKREFGVKTIINMEDAISARMWPWDPKRPSPQALQQAAEERGMTMHHIPVSCVYRPPMDQIHRILDIMDDPEAQPVYVHCFKGFERTNFVVALHRIFRQEVGVREAYKDMLSMGFRRPLVLQLLAQFTDWTRQGAQAGAAVGLAEAVSDKAAAACLVGAALCQRLPKISPVSSDATSAYLEKAAEKLAA